MVLTPRPPRGLGAVSDEWCGPCGGSAGSGDGPPSGDGGCYDVNHYPNNGWVARHSPELQTILPLHVFTSVPASHIEGRCHAGQEVVGGMISECDDVW